MGSSSHSGRASIAPAPRGAGSEGGALDFPAARLRGWTRICVIVGLAFFVSQLVEIPVRSALRGYDNTFNYLWLRSAMVDGDWDFRNDLEASDTLAPEHRASALTLPLTATGRIPNKYGVGWAIVSLPFYVVADGLVVAGRALGVWSLERDGYNAVYQVCLQSGHLALAVLALWLATQAINFWIGSASAARAGVVTIWAGSPLLYYQTVNLSMSHGVGFFSAALLAYALIRVRTDRATDGGDGFLWWMLAGAAWGLATVTRFQLGVIGIVIVAAVFGRGPVRERRDDLADPAARAASHGGMNRAILQRFLALALGAAPLVVVQLIAWRVVYGEWLVFSYGAEGERFDWARPELWASFFSEWHGLFYWHPLLLCAVGGLIGWAWSARGSAIAWLTVFLGLAYISAAWWCWWFASSFGNRSYDAALLPLMAGAAWAFTRLKGRGLRLAWSVAIAAGIWNFYVALLYRSGAISRSEPVTWLEMLTAAARLPEALQF